MGKILGFTKATEAIKYLLLTRQVSQGRNDEMAQLIDWFHASVSSFKDQEVACNYAIMFAETDG